MNHLHCWRGEKLNLYKQVIWINATERDTFWQKHLTPIFQINLHFLKCPQLTPYVEYGRALLCVLDSPQFSKEQCKHVLTAHVGS